CSSYSGSNVLF
nr:immunoglobulin light chain junction region [Macaca mulatta]MPO03509.1 immunoglobulin light chain junction region [Macaca mulatta]MPO03551.1 immunoglobulin light chain junction region [Macaca mulatta]MPO03838.1 immunoglobulin light chain junction region [Macaca mulatta]MPO03991.1 immunoglobulin light chain junction region [Macaca mulatta]